MLMELNFANSIIKLKHFAKLLEVLAEGLPNLQLINLKGITTLGLSEQEAFFLRNRVIGQSEQQMAKTLAQDF